MGSLEKAEVYDMKDMIHLNFETEIQGHCYEVCHIHLKQTPKKLGETLHHQATWYLPVKSLTLIFPW